MSSDIKQRVASNHLPFLDGIRGIAAFYVLLHHAVAISTDFVPMTGINHMLLQWTQYGQIAVAVFIVLSGFCLMLPVTDPQGKFRGGLPQFFYRRARRILPPYYAALALSLILIWICGSLESSRQQLSLTTLVSHILLLHNVNADWNHAINSPMWSVATEWQIYFIFALLLFPVQRKLGMIAATVVAIILGVTPHFLLKQHNLDWAHPWYVLLFSFGMTAAVLSQRESIDPVLGFVRKYSVILLGFFSAVLAVSFRFKTRLGPEAYLIGDTLEGLLMALMIIRLQQQSSIGNRSRVCKLFESKPAVFLGAISYSLYLVHWPILSTLHAMINGRMSGNADIILTLTAGVLLSGVVAFLFYLCVERPFLSSRQRAVAVVTVPENAVDLLVHATA